MVGKILWVIECGEEKEKELGGHECEIEGGSGGGIACM